MGAPRIGIRFQSGQPLITPGAEQAIAATGDSILFLLARHLSGDWGDLSAEDKAESDFSLANGFRLLSAYTLVNGTKIWIITEADRSATTVLLPDEY